MFPVYFTFGSEGEREGNNHQCERETLIRHLLYERPTGDCTHNPGLCPDRELNLSLWQTMPNQWNHTGQGESNLLFKCFLLLSLSRLVPQVNQSTCPSHIHRVFWALSSLLGLTSLSCFHIRKLSSNDAPFTKPSLNFTWKLISLDVPPGFTGTSSATLQPLVYLVHLPAKNFACVSSGHLWILARRHR